MNKLNSIIKHKITPLSFLPFDPVYKVTTANLYLLLAILLSGCASSGIIDNSPLRQTSGHLGYSMTSWAKSSVNDDVSLLISFSGGGTRAAALAYGVLKGLRDSQILIDSKPVRMLDQVDYISSVSGGSFTAAYYGLYGDRIFTDFKDDFLLHDVQHELWSQLFNPVQWLHQGSRSEMAFNYYNKHIFRNATFADMNTGQGPLIIINASDLGNGVRFSFLQEYFDLICSDINSFPIAKAVTASSAVPIVFTPIVLENYSGCDRQEPEWLSKIKITANKDPLLSEMIKGIDLLLRKEQQQYIHLVDGGITDNLGLHAIYDMISLSGGIKQTLNNLEKKSPRHLIIISVDASTEPEAVMGQSKKEPSLAETISAMSDVQLHRYNTTTMEIIKLSLSNWAEALSTTEQKVTPHFIRISLNNLSDPKHQQFFNSIPTSFVLSKKQVNSLIEAGSQLLLNNPQYQQLISEL